MNLADLPKTAKELVMRMPGRFNKEAAGDLRTTIQFKLDGDGGGNIYLSIADQQCTATEGEIASPALTIIAPADVWMKMMRGEINHVQAMMNGFYKVDGDMDLLMKMGKLFSSPGKPLIPAP